MKLLNRNSTATLNKKNHCHTITALRANPVSRGMISRDKSQGRSSFKTEPSTKVNGKGIKKKGLEFRSGQTAPDTKGFGTKIRLVEKASSSMQMVTYTKAAG